MMCLGVLLIVVWMAKRDEQLTEHNSKYCVPT